MRKSFILHLDSLEILKDLTDEQSGKLLKAFYEYNSGIEPELDPITKMVFIPFRNQFIRDLDKYQETCEKNKLNGSKGGRPPKTQKTHSVSNNPLVAKKAYNDSDSKNDNDSDSKNDSDSVNTHHPLFSKTYIQLIEKYGATDVEAEKALDNWNKLTEKDKLNCIGGVQKYFLYLESKPGYSKNDLSYYLKDKMWEWGCIIKMKSKPKTEEEIMKQMDIDFQKYLEEQKNKKQKLKN
jgi:hypothetical protein